MLALYSLPMSMTTPTLTPGGKTFAATMPGGKHHTTRHPISAKPRLAARALCPDTDARALSARSNLRVLGCDHPATLPHRLVAPPLVLAPLLLIPPLALRLLALTLLATVADTVAAVLLLVLLALALGAALVPADAVVVLHLLRGDLSAALVRVVAAVRLQLPAQLVPEAWPRNPLFEGGRMPQTLDTFRLYIEHLRHF